MWAGKNELVSMSPCVHQCQAEGGEMSDTFDVEMRMLVWAMSKCHSYYLETK